MNYCSYIVLATQENKLIQKGTVQLAVYLSASCLFSLELGSGWQNKTLYCILVTMVEGLL